MGCGGSSSKGKEHEPLTPQPQSRPERETQPVVKNPKPQSQKTPAEKLPPEPGPRDTTKQADAAQAPRNVLSPADGGLVEYVLGKQLGSGAFSDVFAAVRKSDNMNVALKRIKIHDMQCTADDRAAFLHEVSLMQCLDHPNIIKYLDSFTENNDLYIVQELAKIGDMEALIQKGKEKGQFLPEKTIWKLFYQLTSAIKYMHEQNILHRDIKPANTFIDNGGLVQIGDVGLGRMFSSLTNAAQSIVGTPLYMSPERIHEKPYSYSSDVWSCGIILYELAALNNPFYEKGINWYELAGRIDKCKYPPLPGHFSHDLTALIDRILVHNPDRRPSIAEVHAIAKGQVESLKKQGTPR